MGLPELRRPKGRIFLARLRLLLVRFVVSVTTHLQAEVAKEASQGLPVDVLNERPPYLVWPNRLSCLFHVAPHE